MKSGIWIISICFLIISIKEKSAFASGEVLVITSNNPNLFLKLKDELRALGFSAVSVLDDGVTPIKVIAQNYKMHMALQVNLKAQTVNVWVQSGDKIKDISRTVQINNDVDIPESIIILAAVDLLRATLFELYISASPKVETPGKVDENEHKQVEPEHIDMEFIIDAGGGFSYIGKNAGIAPVLDAAISLRLLKQFQLGIAGFFPAGQHKINDKTGYVNIFPFMASFEGAYIGLNKNSRLRLLVGGGFGALFLKTRAYPDNDYDADENVELLVSNGTMISPLPYVKFGFLVRINRIVAINAGVMAGWSIAKNTINTGFKTVSNFGRPLLFTNLSLELTLW
ncbi:MAG: hypothetical protein JXR91_08160 [Deltaproteobacteria bacterium]|nr:hypothetical protein [Deltaproteobacteria bacterium]